MDEPQSLSVYHERLQRDDGARLMRLRYYGPRKPSDPDQQIFVERKTHREKWTGERSVKVCDAVLPRGDVQLVGQTQKLGKPLLMRQRLALDALC